MKCFRCGYCCTSLLAVIVVDPDKGIVPDNLTTIGMSGEKERCPHLRGDHPGAYSCAIHDMPWYPETPCAEYQSHWDDTPCRMGEAMIRWYNEGTLPMTPALTGEHDEQADH
jgi:hypothetical protein